MFLHEVHHEQEVNLPRRVVCQVPVVVVVHQSVHHPPGVRVSIAEEQHPEGGDAGEQRTGGLVVVDLNPLRGGGQDLALHPVPLPGLATSYQDTRVFQEVLRV